MKTITNKTNAEILAEMVKIFGSTEEIARNFAELINAVEKPLILHASATKEDYQNAWKHADQNRLEVGTTVRIAKCLHAELAFRRFEK